MENSITTVVYNGLTVEVVGLIKQAGPIEPYCADGQNQPATMEFILKEAYVNNGECILFLLSNMDKQAISDLAIQEFL